MWLIIIAAIFVGGSFVSTNYGSMTGTATSGTESLSVTPAAATGTQVLAEGDWQKVLVGNTSGQSKAGALGANTPSAQTKALNETDRVGQALISRYLQLSQNGATVNSDTANALVSQVLNDPSVVSSAKIYSFSDIKIGNDDSLNADLMYGQTIGALFNDNKIIGNDEAVDARDSVEQNNPTILAKIDPIIASYKNILIGLLNTTAPPSLASTHLDFINAMSERMSIAKLLRSIDNDPTAGLEGVGRYMTGVQDLFNAFEKLRIYFASRGVYFGTTATSTKAASMGH